MRCSAFFRPEDARFGPRSVSDNYVRFRPKLGVFRRVVSAFPAGGRELAKQRLQARERRRADRLAQRVQPRGPRPRGGLREGLQLTFVGANARACCAATCSAPATRERETLLFRTPRGRASDFDPRRPRERLASFGRSASPRPAVYWRLGLENRIPTGFRRPTLRRRPLRTKKR